MSNIVKILNCEMRFEKYLVAHYKKLLNEGGSNSGTKDKLEELIRRHETCINMLRRIARHHKKRG